MTANIKINDNVEVSDEAKIMLDVEKVFKTTYLDIPYANEHELQKLDILIPNEEQGPFPLVVYIHGGGWCFGDKRNVHTISALQLAYEGYAVATINYRLSEVAKWPAQIYDCKAAIRFLRANAEKYNLIADKIGVIGNSAGGHLTGMLATTGGMPEFEDLSMGNEKYSSSIQAAAIWFGVFDFTSNESHYIELSGTNEGYLEGKSTIDNLFGFNITSDNEIVKNASPITHIHKDMPPILLQQGTSDLQVPYLQSIDFFKKYIRMCGDKNIHLDLLEGARHGDNAFRVDENLVKVIRFMDKNIMGVNNRTYCPIPAIPRV